MLNLTITYPTSITLVHNTPNAVQEIGSFVSASPKQMQCFLDESDTKQHLQEFPYTRWSQHEACLSIVIANYEHFCFPLWIIYRPAQTTGVTQLHA